MRSRALPKTIPQYSLCFRVHKGRLFLRSLVHVQPVGTTQKAQDDTDPLQEVSFRNTVYDLIIKRAENLKHPKCLPQKGFLNNKQPQ